MIEQAFIDDINIFDRYGLRIAPSAMTTLVQWPTLKNISTTEWAEYDGEEVDLSDPLVEGRQVSLTFSIADISKLDDLLAQLSNGALHSFRHDALGREDFYLRLMGMSSIETARRLGKITLTFADDNPYLPADIYDEPVPYIPTQGVKIGDDEDHLTDLSQYGARVLQGTTDTFRQWASVRENLKRNIKSIPGIIYDNHDVHFRPKDGTLKLLMHAKPKVFWCYYYRLFNACIAPGQRLLYFTRLNKVYACYYRQQAIKEFEICTDGQIWCKFDITLRLIEWPNEEAIGALAAEVSEHFTTTQHDDLILPA